jgi:hypothetical protein
VKNRVSLSLSAFDQLVSFSVFGYVLYRGASHLPRLMSALNVGAACKRKNLAAG